MRIIDDIDQLSSEWFEIRAGRPTASCFDQILTPTGLSSKQAKKYMYTLAGERITRKKEETFQSQAMLDGIEREEKARLYFELVMDMEVKQVASCIHDSELFSCSPDGLMENTGIEIKCPKMSTHVEYLLGNKIPTKYIPQVQGSMLITGYNHWYFMSYYEGLKPLIIDVPRDDSYCAKLKIELEEFYKELDAVTKRLN